MQEAIERLSDDDLKRALLKVAGPIIDELGRRGYEVAVTSLNLHVNKAKGVRAAHRVVVRDLEAKLPKGTGCG